MDMADSSPDPLTLPSSQVGIRKQLRQSSHEPLYRHSPGRSPAKSFIMDTGKAGDASPWRIKVTVEAEPREGGSPSRDLKRTISVPVKGLSSSSSVKKSEAGEEKAERRPARKRKGTPVRRPTKRLPQALSNEESAKDDVLYNPRPYEIPAIKRGKLHKTTTLRSQRLSQAREELDWALQDAVGNSHSRFSEVLSSPSKDKLPGDMTLSMNEDMTMVSLHSLDSYQKGAVGLTTDKAGDKYGLGASSMPSSPPEEVQYPDLIHEVEGSKVNDPRDFDPMSWRPTTIAKNYASLPEVQKSRSAFDILGEPSHWQRERQAVSNVINNANASQVIVIDDTETQYQRDNNEDRAEVGTIDVGEDIWQEASRSFDDTEHLPSTTTQARHRSPTPVLDDLFVGQTLRPPRGKIPKTWRRSSGMEFSYVDSPAPPEETQPECKESAQDDGTASKASIQRSELSWRSSAVGTDAGNRSDGVLTPPSTDDEVNKARHEAESSELTEPDAAATQLQHSRIQRYDDEVRGGAGTFDMQASRSLSIERLASPVQEKSIAEVSSTNMTGSGLFWNRPSRAPCSRYQRSSVSHAPDLSDLFDLGNSSPAKQQARPERTSKSPIVRTSKVIEFRKQDVHYKGSRIGKLAEQKLESGTADVRHIVEDRQSRTRNIQSATKLGQRRHDVQCHQQATESDLETEEEDEPQTGDDVPSSQEDQSSDNGNSVSAGFSSGGRNSTKPVSSDSAIKDHEGDDVTEESGSSKDQTASYEERLNLDTPRKVQVNFNNSTIDSSPLVPRKIHMPKFVASKLDAPRPTAVPRTKEPAPIFTVFSKSTVHIPQLKRFPAPGLLSRLSSTIWTSLLPTGPTFIELSAPYPPSLRAVIRERYSVVRNVFPWTMIHMRTLHRMLNSCTSGKWDSVIPKPGSTAPIPFMLDPLIGTVVQSHNSGPFDFSHQHAHVVAAFMQVMVPNDVVEAMERGDIEWLGDSDMTRYRGCDLWGRHGNDVLWPNITGETWWSKGGKIDEMFIARAVMDCAYDNVLLCEERGWTNPGLGR